MIVKGRSAIKKGGCDAARYAMTEGKILVAPVVNRIKDLLQCRTTSIKLIVY